MAMAYANFFPMPCPQPDAPLRYIPSHPPPPKRISMVEGGQVDYFISVEEGWTPATILEVNNETGAMKLDYNPHTLIELHQQRAKLRPRTKPQREQLEHLRMLLREGRIGGEVHKLFDKFSCFAGVEAVLPERALPQVADEVDKMLGICGAWRLLQKACQNGGVKALTLDHFTEVFWEMLWRVQHEHGAALDTEACQRQKKKSKQPYNLDTKLGEGSYGAVYFAVCPDTGAKRAVKAIGKAGSQQHTDPEITNLLALDHPNIVKLYEHYEDKKFHYLVMDFCSGGDLMATVERRKSTGCHFEEGYVRDIMQQVLKAIAHVHARGIMHLDLKSANIMLMPSKSTMPPSKNSTGSTLANSSARPHVMVIDLGVAQFFRPGNIGDGSPTGTPVSMAPEVWMGELTPKADVFSLGVIFFELLSLSYPFKCGPDHRLALAYWRRKPEPDWTKVQHRSDYAVGLCRRMLLVDRHRRPAAAKALQASFFNAGKVLKLGEAELLIPADYLERLTRVPQRTLLHNSLALAIARDWPANQLPTIKRIFQELDSQHKGRLDIDQISSALERWGVQPEAARVAADAMDFNRDGTIGWTEFVAACIHLGDDDLEPDLQRLFTEADADSDGMLGQADLAALLAADHLQGQTAQDVMSELSGRTEASARVDWPTFRRHFRTRSREADPVDPLPYTSSASGNSGSFPRPATKPTMWPQADEVSAMWSEAAGFFDRGLGALFPDGQRSESQYQANLEILADMGLHDRDRNLAALRKCGNAITEGLMNELLLHEV